MRYIYLLLLLLTNLYSYSYNVITSDTFNPVKDDTYNPNDILSSKKDYLLLIMVIIFMKIQL